MFDVANLICVRTPQTNVAMRDENEAKNNE